MTDERKTAKGRTERRLIEAMDEVRQNLVRSHVASMQWVEGRDEAIRASERAAEVRRMLFLLAPAVVH